MNKKYKKVCATLNPIDDPLILAFLFIIISAFASLLGIPIGIISSVTGLKFCVVTAGIKRYKLIIKKKKKSTIK